MLSVFKQRQEQVAQTEQKHYGKHTSNQPASPAQDLDVGPKPTVVATEQNPTPFST